MIAVNFATKNYRFITRMQAIFVSVALLLAIGSVLIVWFATGLRSEIAVMEKRTNELRASEDEFRPVLAEREQVFHDLSAMKGLMQARRFSWTNLLDDLETVFPVGVAVEKLDFNPRNRILTLHGVARSPESLRNLIEKFERSSLFKNPYLKQQSIDKGSISFHVVANYQEYKTAGMGHGK